MSQFRGKVIAITGAASGIGRALAVELAGRGADVALSDVNEEGLAETVAHVERLGRKASSRRLDVASRDEFEAWFPAILEEHGRADGIVNNAGVTVQDTIAELSYEDFEWVMGVNFWGVIYGTKSFLPHLLAQRSGWIVNVSSIFGMIAFPSQGAYNATKFAVRGFTEALCLESRDSGVTICSVHPGGIKTNIVKNARIKHGMTGELEDPDDAAAQFERMARTTPKKAAEVIADGMENGEHRIMIGQDARMIDRIQRVFPGQYGKALAAMSKILDR